MNFSDLWNPAVMSKIVNPDGTKTQYFFTWLNLLYEMLKGTIGQGFTGTVVTAKLTVGGTNGSITFTNGVVTQQVAAT
jgi:hypothetical protein